MKQLTIASLLFLLCTFSIEAMANNMNQGAFAPVVSRILGDVKVLRNEKWLRASDKMALKKGDEIYTGRRSKAYIDFPDHSRVKLGHKSHFLVQDWREEKGVFFSTLSIFRGAFRYTASAIRQFTARQTTLTTPTAVLGVRGTDFWGRVGKHKTFLLLIEGEVSLTPVQGDTIIYNDVLHAVDIQASTISKPKALSMENIAPLAEETEINP